MTNEQISELIDMVVAGNTELFEQLYNVTINDVYRTLYMLCDSERDAEDVTQNVYLELYRNLHKFDRNRTFYGWVYGIMIRQFQTHKRKRWREQRKENKQREMHVEIPTTIENQFDRDQDEMVILELNKLPDKLKQVLVLRYVNELSQQEIAEVLEIPLGTVKSRLNQGLLRMRKVIRREEHAGK